MARLKGANFSWARRLYGPDAGAPQFNTAQVREAPREQRYADRPALSEFLSQPTPKSPAERNDLIYDAYRRYGYSMTWIGNALGLHNSTISRII
jgi:hypothetical protein